MVIYREDNHSDVATNRVTYTAGVRPKLETKFFLHAGLAPQDMAIELTTLFHVGFALYDTGHLLGGLHFQFEDRMPFRVVHGDFVIHFDFFLVRNYSLKDVFSAAVSMRMAEQASLKVGLNDLNPEEVSFEIQIGYFTTKVLVPRRSVVEYLEFSDEE